MEINSPNLLTPNLSEIFIEDENVVVFEPVIEGAKEAVFLALERAEELKFRAAAPTTEQQCAVSELVIVETHHAAGSRGSDDV